MQEPSHLSALASGASPEVSDGLSVLRTVIGLPEIASLVERTARWVSPDTFRLLPLWFPEHARKRHFYKSNWSEPQMNMNQANGVESHKFEGNVHANKALTLALGLRAKLRPNWSCCHIWGNDDTKFQNSNYVVMDNRFFSCIGNMLLLPTPLKAFTDAIPEIKAMIRICARNLYGWQCDHESMTLINNSLDAWADWKSYPNSWPKQRGEKLPLGVVELTPAIEKSIEMRKRAIRYDLENAGQHYPRQQVLEALAYWKINLS